MSNIDSCPLCGTPVHVVGTDEGTQHYEPVARPILLLDNEEAVDRLRRAAFDPPPAWETEEEWARYIIAALREQQRVV